MKTIAVSCLHQRYSITVGDGIIDNKSLWHELVAARQVVILTDQHVAPLHLPRLLAGLERQPSLVITLTPGESQKQLATVETIVGKMLEHGIGRQAVLLAFGGGVIGDLAGFVAAVYMRGIDVLQIPTTLLAQCDAAIGGKTAVNHPLGKNMMGAFHQPHAVISDCSLLNTLPAREFHAGMAEVVKYGAIRDEPFLSWLDARLELIEQREPATLSELVVHCSEIKASIVAQDECDNGVRALLNFGHTFAHGIEQLMNYHGIVHGEAVAIGMVLACRLSKLVNNFSDGELNRLVQLLRRLNLPTVIPTTIDSTKLLPSMATDKKKKADKLRFILLKALGQAYIYDNVDRNALTSIISNEDDYSTV